MSVAPNYKEVFSFYYDKYIVTPSTQLDTIAKPAGKYTVKTVILEWYRPEDIENVIKEEFPSAEGWIYNLPQPSKPQEELDMFNMIIVGTKRETN